MHGVKEKLEALINGTLDYAKTFVDKKENFPMVRELTEIVNNALVAHNRVIQQSPSGVVILPAVVEQTIDGEKEATPIEFSISSFQAKLANLFDEIQEDFTTSQKKSFNKVLRDAKLVETVATLADTQLQEDIKLAAADSTLFKTIEE